MVITGGVKHHRCLCDKVPPWGAPLELIPELLHGAMEYCRCAGANGMHHADNASLSKRDKVRVGDKHRRKSDPGPKIW